MASTIAILLSGGKGSRLGKPGRQLPKPLTRIGDEPVINTVIDKLLCIPDVRTIYVLLRKEQGLDKTSYDGDRVLDLKEHFEGWRTIWYGPHHPHSGRVQTLYEDDLDPDNLVKDEGAIAGLLRFLRAAPEKGYLRDVERVVVAAADNYFPDEDLKGFFARSSAEPRVTYNGSKDLGDPEKVRGKYGCILLEGDWICGFEEKPKSVTEKHHRASVGLYSFPPAHFEKIADYAQLPGASLGPPGEFLAWLAGQFVREPGRDRTEGVKAYEIHGHWFDIGNPTELKIAYFWYTQNVLGQIRTVEDLVVARATHRVDDRSYLLCHHLSVSSSKRTIRIYFKATDPLCSLRPDSRRLQTVQEIAGASAQRSVQELWRDLTRALEGKEDFHWHDGEPPDGIPPQLPAPLLLSAGVFLLDYDHRVKGKIPRTRALLPLLEKDAGSRTDPRRVTTAAGRMDDLDFMQVCADELFEELVFFGRERDTHKTRIYCPTFRADRRRELLERLLDAKLAVPGITEEDVESELGKSLKDYDLVENVPVEVFEPPAGLAWTVEVYLGRHDELANEVSYEKMYVRDGFLAIPDYEVNTLEFRIICGANVFGHDRIDASRMQIGRIRGIVDGDGFRRMPIVIKAEELERYYGWLTTDERDKNDLLQLLNRSQREEATLWAVGDGVTGLFKRFESKVPALFMTTSVEHLARNLPQLLA